MPSCFWQERERQCSEIRLERSVFLSKDTASGRAQPLWGMERPCPALLAFPSTLSQERKVAGRGRGAGEGLRPHPGVTDPHSRPWAQRILLRPGHWNRASEAHSLTGTCPHWNPGAAATPKWPRSLWGKHRDCSADREIGAEWGMGTT